MPPFLVKRINKEARSPDGCELLVLNSCWESSLSFLYSLLSASTGSFFAAALEGMRPARNVSNTLMPTRAIAACHGRIATFSTSNNEYTIAFAGMHARAVSPMPITPADDDGFGVEYTADIALARTNRA